MKRIQYNRYGGPEVMQLESFDLPSPGRGEILVRVKAASINPVDWKLRQGAMKVMTGSRFPRLMGNDFSGVVESVGSDVTDLQVGDEVFGATEIKPSGAFGEALVTKAKSVIKKPAALSHANAAALPTIGLTAWRGLVDAAKLKAGQSVFVNGAAGGVGQAAAYLAKSLGASVTGRVGPGSVADAARLGLDKALDYTQPPPADLAGSFDVVFDCNGSLSIDEQDMLLKRSGMALDINPTGEKIFRSLLSKRRKFVMGSASQERLAKIGDLAATGKLPVPVGRTAPLSEAIGLISDLEAGRRCEGKAVILMD
jgi:NADPH:quinone reductase-like Zn-dependent oxidoreductase